VPCKRGAVVVPTRKGRARDARSRGGRGWRGGHRSGRSSHAAGLLSVESACIVCAYTGAPCQLHAASLLACVGSVFAPSSEQAHTHARTLALQLSQTFTESCMYTHPFTHGHTQYRYCPPFSSLSQTLHMRHPLHAHACACVGGSQRPPAAAGPGLCPVVAALWLL